MASSKIVLCSGCWDILHIGHLRHLQAARRYGDWLVVSVTKDAYVKKGPRRPVFSDRERREMVGALNCVDRTVLVADQIEAFEMVNPQVFVKGGDYLTRIDQEHRDYCKAHGIEIVFTNEVHYSSTDLLHYYDPAHSST
jgi:rfaE bifunctional protein nucleotidyltransferase chain/domain